MIPLSSNLADTPTTDLSLSGPSSSSHIPDILELWCAQRSRQPPSKLKDYICNHVKFYTSKGLYPSFFVFVRYVSLSPHLL